MLLLFCAPLNVVTFACTL